MLTKKSLLENWQVYSPSDKQYHMKKKKKKKIIERNIYVLGDIWINTSNCSQSLNGKWILAIALSDLLENEAHSKFFNTLTCCNKHLQFLSVSFPGRPIFFFLFVHIFIIGFLLNMALICRFGIFGKFWKKCSPFRLLSIYTDFIWADTLSRTLCC